MIDSMKLTGLIVKDISPVQNSINVNVNSKIIITFNADLNTKSIINNIVILRDKEFVYKNGSMKNIEAVKGNLSYKDRKIFFIPDKPLKPNTRYVVSIKKDICSLDGTSMEFDFSSTFFTECVETLPPVNIISPSKDGINENIEFIKWEKQQSNIYLIQISKVKTFEVLAYEKIIKIDEDDKCSISLEDLKLDDSLYYLRIKSPDGEWSNITQFLIKHKKEGLVSYEDAFDIDIDSKTELEVIDMFPSDKQLLVDKDLKSLYVIVKGEVKEEDIDFSNSYVYGEEYSLNNKYSDKDQGLLSGTWNVIYDKDKDESYIIFSIDD